MIQYIVYALTMCLIADIDKVLENIDDEIAVYLTDDKKLKVDYILSEMSEVVIYPHEVRIKIPSFSKDLLVKRFQFVKEQNTREQQYDGALHGHALSSVRYSAEERADAL